MSITFLVQGREFIPLAAVPVVTDGVISEADIVRILANAEAFADPDHELMPIVLVIDPKGQVQAPSDGYFRRWMPPTMGRPPHIPLKDAASVLVRKHELKALFGLLKAADTSSGPSRSSRAKWDEDRTMPEEVAAAIRDHCFKYLSPIRRRKDSRMATEDRVRDAIKKIEKRAQENGVSLDRRQLPGVRRDFLAIVKQVDPTIRIGEGTFNKSYVPKLGIAWRKGAKPMDGVALLRLFNLKPSRRIR